MNHDIKNQYAMALKYHDQGLQLVSLPIGKKFARKNWKYIIEQPQTTDDIKNMFSQEKRNTAIYSGPESGNFVTIDIDRPDLFSWYSLNIRNFADIATRTLSCKSAGRGGVHLGIKTSELLTSTNFQDPRNPQQKGGDIIARGGYALYPRSELKGGHYEMLFDDFNGIIEIDITDPALKDFVNTFNLRQYIEPEPLPDTNNTTGIIYKNNKPYGLSMRAWVLLTQGDIDGRYSTPSESDQAVITECVLKGWSLETVKELFRRHGYREKHKRQDYIEISYKSAERYLALNKNQIDQEIDQLYALVYTWPWKGQAGRTDRDVTQALLEIARRRRSLESFGASIREIGELSGISHFTAHKALSRIPFIYNADSNGITYTFSLKAPINTPCELNGIVLQSQNIQDKNADVFRWSGLGKTGADIYRTLLENGESDIKTLTEKSKVAQRTIYNKLNDLERAGLVTIRKQGRQTLLKANPGADLEKAAEIIGTAGTLKNQINRHERERKAYQNYINKIKH